MEALCVDEVTHFSSFGYFCDKTFAVGSVAEVGRFEAVGYPRDRPTSLTFQAAEIRVCFFQKYNFAIFDVLLTVHRDIFVQ
jgi:hypothetical protein